MFIFHFLQTTIAFLNDTGLVHGAIGPEAIFIDRQGDWKLTGFDSVLEHSQFASTQVLSSQNTNSFSILIFPGRGEPRESYPAALFAAGICQAGALQARARDRRGLVDGWMPHV